MHSRGTPRSDAVLRDATRLTRLLAALNEPAPTDAYLDRILSTISELFLVDIAVLLDPDGRGDYEPVASIGLPDNFDRRLFEVFRTAGAFEIPRTGMVGDGAGPLEEPRIIARLKELGAASGASIPVAGSRGPRGVMLLARCKPVPFEREEMDLLSTMAYRIGLALEQIGQRNQLELLVRGMREVIRRPDDSSIREEAVRLFALLVRADAAAILGRSSDGALVCEKATFDPGQGAAAAVPPAAAAVHAALPFEDEPPESDYIRASSGSESTAALSASLGYPCETFLAAYVPIAGRSGKWLIALRRRPISFGEGSRQIASLYSRQIGSFLEKAALYADVSRELGERAKAEAALRENEKALRSRHDELQNMVTMRDQLFSIIGHDLRGPVASMCNLLRFVIEEPQGAAPRERIGILPEILKAGESISLLLNNLMEWGKAQRASAELRPRPIVLRIGVEDVFALLGSQAAAKGVELIDEVEPGLRLLADADCLQTILRNLVTNAVKFTNPGGRVSVSASRQAGRVRVVVADTGLGMDEAALSAAFDSSARRSTHGTAGEKGIGLGLMLCKDLAEINGGSIGVESEAGKGTVVAIELGACD
jgi:signal transduction histidine kinase